MGTWAYHVDGRGYRIHHRACRKKTDLPGHQRLTLYQVNSMTLLTDLDAFVYDHRAPGRLTADASKPAWNGYLLTLACSRGVVFERWVTPEEADADILRFTSVN